MIPSMTYVGLAALVLIIFNSLTFTNGFDCYTGDGEILRRKTCPNFANICFKKMPGCKYHIIESKEPSVYMAEKLNFNFIT